MSPLLCFIVASFLLYSFSVFCVVAFDIMDKLTSYKYDGYCGQDKKKLRYTFIMAPLWPKYLFNHMRSFFKENW